MRIKLYLSLFVAFCIIVVNYYAGILNAYWLFPWFDIPMHIAGGLMVGLFAQTGIDFVRQSGFEKQLFKRRFLLVSLSVFAVGIVWEAVELYFGLTDGLGPISRFDTIKDLIDDIIGGALSIWFWSFLFNKNKN